MHDARPSKSESIGEGGALGVDSIVSQQSHVPRITPRLPIYCAAMGAAGDKQLSRHDTIYFLYFHPTQLSCEISNLQLIPGTNSCTQSLQIMNVLALKNCASIN